MSTEPTIVIGKLDDKELRSSIEELVNYVKSQAEAMAASFNTPLREMQDVLKGFKETKVSSTRSGGLKDEEQSVKSVAESYDQLAKAKKQAIGVDVTQEQVSAQEQLNKKIQRQAEIIRERMQAQGTNFARFGNNVFYQPGTNKEARSIEQQLLDAHNAAIRSAQERVAAEQRVNQTKQEGVILAQQQAQAEQQVTNATQQRSNTQPKRFEDYEDFRQALGHVLKLQANEIQLANEDTASYQRLQVTLKQLQEAYNKLDKRGRDSDMGKTLVASMQEVERAMQKIQQQAKRPVSLKQILSIEPKTLDDIAYKISQLQAYRQGINFTAPNAEKEIQQVNAAITQLQARQKELLGQNKGLLASNNALARSFNYIKNRLAFVFTVGATTSFVKQIYDIRAQYELLERSIGILYDSMQEGARIFAELNAMAIKSPFTTMELGAAAKQLSAYGVAAKDVVDTTRRLADIAAAVGAPIERLTYALGQIKSYEYLNSRDARMFMNAGIPLVKNLADMYTQLEGRLVSVGDVNDRIKKKAVSYEDVTSVINQMTDEGGRFFNYQEKAADSLKIKLANLTLAYNNMLNQIGKDNQGILSEVLEIPTAVFSNWKELNHIIIEAIVAFGAYKAWQLIVNRLMDVTASMVKRNILADKQKIALDLQKAALTRELTLQEKLLIANKHLVTHADYENILSSKLLTKEQALLLVALNKKNAALLRAMINMGLLTESEIKNITTTKVLRMLLHQVGITLKGIGAQIAAMAKSTWWMWLLGAMVEAFHTYGEIQDQIKEINKGVADSAEESRKSISKMLKELESVRQRAATNDISEEEGVKAWERIKEEIELSSAASDVFIKQLEKTGNTNQKIAKGFGYLQMLNDVNGALEQIDEKAIEINGDWSKWWNFWAGSDGLIENIQDYVEMLEAVHKLRNAPNGEYLVDEAVRYDKEKLMSDIDDTTESMINAFQTAGITSGEAMREAFERSNKEILKNANLSAKQRLHYNIEAEKSFIKNRIALFDEEARHERERGNEDRAKRIEAEKTAWVKSFGSGESISKAFYEFLQNQHSSEINAMFANMSKEEMAHIDWSSPKWKRWAEDMARSFSEQNDIAFGQLRQHVLEANKLQINIPLYFGSDNMSDFQKDIKKRIAQAPKVIDFGGSAFLPKTDQTLPDWAKEQRDSIKKLREDRKAYEKDSSDYSTKQIKKIDREITQRTNLLGLYKLEAEEEKKKNNGTKKDVLGEALQKEVELVNNITKKYKEYRDAGVNSTDAIDKTAQEYNKTLTLTNKTLAKFGITSTKTAQDIANMPLRDVVSYLQTLLKGAQAQGNAKGIEAIEKAIANLNVEITKTDYKQFKESLDSSLSKINDQYELAIDLEANPELGESFMQAFGIVPEQLPRTLKQYADDVLAALNKYFKDTKQSLELPTLQLSDDDLRYYAQQVQNKELTQGAYDAIVKAVENYRTRFKKASDDNIKDWNKLIAKYGELQNRIYKIQQETADERLSFIKQFSGDNDEVVSTAITLKTKLDTEEDPTKRQELIDDLKSLTQELAGTDEARIRIKTSIDKSEVERIAHETFEDFQKEPEWLISIGDLSGMTHKALGILIKDLQDFKKNTQGLSEKDLKRLTKAIATLQKQQRKDSPFSALVDSIKQARERVEPLRAKLKGLEEEYEKLFKATDKGNKGTKEQIAKLAELGQQIAGTKAEMKALSRLSAKEVVDALQKAYGAIQPVIGGIGEMFAAFGNEDAANAIKAFEATIDKGMQFAQLGAMVGGVWGAAIGGIIGGLMGLFTSLADIISGNAAITEQVEDSERAVKRLENRYKRLEHAIEQAFGAEEVGLKASEIANKKLQLQETQRQLQLEQRRTSKYRDEDKIIDLEGRIIDLEQEIQDLEADAINNLLGISSVSDAVEDMVGTIIDSLRNGEDAMSNFNESINEMIANMIKQVFSAKVLGPMFQSIWDNIEEQILGKSELQRAAEYLDIYQKRLDQVASQNGKGWLFYRNYNGSYSFAKTDSDFETFRQHYLQNRGRGSDYTEATYEEWKAYMEKLIEEQKEKIDELSIPTMDDIKTYAEQLRGVSPEISGYIDTLQSILQEMGLIKDTTKDKTLSLLQQGIQGITEDTAGALEGMLNGMSQQVYLQSNLMTQIRDTLVSFDSDAQLGTLGEMLLQLQISTQTQNAIKSILEGTLNPSGRAIMVELNA